MPNPGGMQLKTLKQFNVSIFDATLNVITLRSIVIRE